MRGSHFSRAQRSPRFGRHSSWVWQSTATKHAIVDFQAFSKGWWVDQHGCDRPHLATSTYWRMRLKSLQTQAMSLQGYSLTTTTPRSLLWSQGLIYEHWHSHNNTAPAQDKKFDTVAPTLPPTILPRRVPPTSDSFVSFEHEAWNKPSPNTTQNVLPGHLTMPRLRH